MPVHLRRCMDQLTDFLAVYSDFPPHCIGLKPGGDPAHLKLVWSYNTYTAQTHVGLTTSFRKILIWPLRLPHLPLNLPSCKTRGTTQNNVPH